MDYESAIWIFAKGAAYESSPFLPDRGLAKKTCKLRWGGGGRGVDNSAFPYLFLILSFLFFSFLFFSFLFFSFLFLSCLVLSCLVLSCLFSLKIGLGLLD